MVCVVPIACFNKASSSVSMAVDGLLVSAVAGVALASVLVPCLALCSSMDTRRAWVIVCACVLHNGGSVCVLHNGGSVCVLHNGGSVR